MINENEINILKKDPEKFKEFLRNFDHQYIIDQLSFDEEKIEKIILDWDYEDEILKLLINYDLDKVFKILNIDKDDLIIEYIENKSIDDLFNIINVDEYDIFRFIENNNTMANNILKSLLETTSLSINEIMNSLQDYDIYELFDSLPTNEKNEIFEGQIFEYIENSPLSHKKEILDFLIHHMASNDIILALSNLKCIHDEDKKQEVCNILNIDKKTLHQVLKINQIKLLDILYLLKNKNKYIMYVEELFDKIENKKGD